MALAVVGFYACGGSGGGGDSGSPSSSSNGTGTVAVFLTDGPADEYDELWVNVTEVSLIPHDDGSTTVPVVVYTSTSEHWLNLLAFRDEDFLLTVNNRIPAGSYEKIRLRIREIKPVGGSCTDMEIKLPSGKIDLVPGGTFEVEPGETLVIRLDIDANKSINLKKAGKSGKCVFRPVIFVDIEPLGWMPGCPKIVRGELVEFIDDDNGNGIEGFKLKLSGDRGTLDVYVSDNTVIFGDDGLSTAVDDLAAGQRLWVRGCLDSKGYFQASEVVIGEVIRLNGIAQSIVNEQNTFSLAIDPGQSITDQTISVALSGKTLLLMGCDDAVEKSAIIPGLPLQVIGKVSLEDQTFRAIVIFVKPLSGELLSKEDAQYGSISGSNLHIRIDESTTMTVFLPARNPIGLVGDGEIPLNLLCTGKNIYVMVDPVKSDELSILTASEIKVPPDTHTGYCASIDTANRTISIDNQIVRVADHPTIVDLRGTDDTLVDFDELGLMDKVNCFGLAACDSDDSVVDFYAFVVLIVEDDD